MRLFLNFKNLISFVLLSFTMLISNAQTEPQCGTVSTPESEKYFQDILPQVREYENEYYQKAQQRSSTALSSVPVKIHVIRTDEGLGGFNAATVNTIINDMNVFYANAFLEFFICEDINFINSTEYYDFSTDEQDALTDANNVNNVINIYFANSVSTAEGGGLCGYAYFPGGPEVIMMDNSCAINGSTMPHEMGHFFALSHTHGNSNGTLTTELVDGSNCDTDGDFICDTPADPQLGFSNVSSSCQYTGNTVDANGDVFTPEPRNIMSYSRKVCRTEFSPEQYARIYGVYQASRAVMACPTFNVDVAADFTRECSNTMQVDFTDNSTGATSWEWDVDGDDITDYTIQNPSHIYNGLGSYDVTLTISNGSETLTKVYEDYITVGGETTNTSQIILTLNTDDWPAETSWVFRDNSGTALYSSPTYVEGDDDFTTFTETFDVSTNECYSFEIIDSYGDGICCFSGNGSYTLTTLEGEEFATGGNFSSGEIIYIANDTTLGTDDYFISNPISLYPNPTKEIVNIQLANNDDLPDAYVVYNMLGQEVMKQRISQPNDLSINASSLSAGMYYIKLTKSTNATTLSFIKN